MVSSLTHATFASLLRAEVFANHATVVQRVRQYSRFITGWEVKLVAF
jgi:hypothetical protein